MKRDEATTRLSQENNLLNLNNPVIQKGMEHYYYSDEDDEILQGNDTTKNSLIDRNQNNDFKKTNCWNGFMLCLCIPKNEKISNPKSLSALPNRSQNAVVRPSIKDVEPSPMETPVESLPVIKVTVTDKCTQAVGMAKGRSNESSEEIIEDGDAVSVIDDSEFLDANDNHDKENCDEQNASTGIEKNHFYVSSDFFALYSPSKKCVEDEDTDSASCTRPLSSEKSPSSVVRSIINASETQILQSQEVIHIENIDSELCPPLSSEESHLSDGSSLSPANVFDILQTQVGRYRDFQEDILNDGSCSSSSDSNCTAVDSNQRKMVRNKVPAHQPYLLEFLKTLLSWMFLNQIAAAIFNIGSKKKQPFISQSYEKVKDD